jgi:hypothetical protein
MHFIDFWKAKEMDFKKKLYWTKIKVQAFFIKLKINMNPKVRNLELSEEKSEELYQKIMEKINNEK